MAPPFRGEKNSFLIYNRTSAKFCPQPIPDFEKLLQNLHLHLPHDPHRDLSRLRIPGGAQHGLFLLQTLQGFHGLFRIRILRKDQPVRKHRFQQTRLPGRLTAKALPGPHPGKPADGADPSRLRLLLQTVGAA